MNTLIRVSKAQAIVDIIDHISRFRDCYGYEAVRDAIVAGAFHAHQDYGDIKEIILYGAYNQDKVTVPDWIKDIFVEYFYYV